MTISEDVAPPLSLLQRCSGRHHTCSSFRQSSLLLDPMTVSFLCQTKPSDSLGDLECKIRTEERQVARMLSAVDEEPNSLRVPPRYPHSFRWLLQREWCTRIREYRRPTLCKRHIRPYCTRVLFRKGSASPLGVRQACNCSEFPVKPLIRLRLSR